MTWTWFDLDDKRGVLELNSVNPSLELELMLFFDDGDNPTHAVWIYSPSGKVLWWVKIGIA
jgi:hypothetical protein